MKIYSNFCFSFILSFFFWCMLSRIKFS